MNFPRAYIVANYWQLPPQVQQEIKEAHLVTPLYTWQVQGQFCVQCKSAYGFTSTGLCINTTIEAFTDTDAAEKLLNNLAVNHKNVTSVEWLNDGPVVKRVLEQVYY